MCQKKKRYSHHLQLSNIKICCFPKAAKASMFGLKATFLACDVLFYRLNDILFLTVKSYCV